MNYYEKSISSLKKYHTGTQCRDHFSLHIYSAKEETQNRFCETKETKRLNMRVAKHTDDSMENVVFNVQTIGNDFAHKISAQTFKNRP